MYDNVKHQGKPLVWWRDNVFHGTYSLGELYQMVQEGKDLSKIVPKSAIEA